MIGAKYLTASLKRFEITLQFSISMFTPCCRSCKKFLKGTFQPIRITADRAPIGTSILMHRNINASKIDIPKIVSEERAPKESPVGIAKTRTANPQKVTADFLEKLL